MTKFEYHVQLYSEPTPNGLTHCGLIMPNGDIDQVNIGLGNGLVLPGTKPLPEPMLTYMKYLLWHLHESPFTSAHEPNLCL